MRATEFIIENENTIKFDVHTPDNFKTSFQITLSVHGKHVGHFNFVRSSETDDVNNEVEVESRFLGQGYGKLLLLKAIDVANSHRLDFQQDIRGITDAQQNVYDSLENAGLIVTPGDGFWFLTPQGEKELAPLNEDIKESVDTTKKIGSAVIDFYHRDVGDIKKQPIDNYVEKANQLLKQADPKLKPKLIDIFKKGKDNPYIQGGIVTTVGAVLAGGVLSSAQRMGLNPSQTNLMLQAILNTVIPTVVSRINGKSWIDTAKYTLASAGIGIGVGLAGLEEDAPIKIDNYAKAKEWIKKVYDKFPQTWQNNHVMPMGGEGDNQQFAMFELTPSMSKKNAVEVKWFQAYPLRHGVGSRAMRVLQDMAREDGIGLTLFPWQHGQVSQPKLMKFYKAQGFQPTVKGAKNLSWSPKGVTEAFDQPYKGKWEKSDYGDVDMLAKLPDGTNLSIMFNNQQGDEGEEVVQVEFYRNNSQDVTGEGDAQRIFATVLDAIQKYIKKYKPARLSFSASKQVEQGQNSESRAKLYDKLVQRYAKAWGYRAFRADNGDLVIYELSRIKQGVAEGVPQPGESSGAPKQFGPDAKITTRKMTVGQIISSIPGVPYYNNVVDDWDAKDYHSWNVTEKAIEYAEYFKKHPESLSQLPPILVLNGKFEDGAHRVSAIWLLQQRMDPKNPLWANAKLNVQFVKQGVAENFADGKGPGRPGDSQRHGIPKHATLAQLDKISHEGGRKGQLAHWQANMRRGRNK